jgi:TRAP-type mannitol/chloroaromatic compound transport system permease small subunit
VAGEIGDASPNDGVVTAVLRLRAAFDSLVSAMNACGTLVIALLAVLINADVFGRALFRHPLPGVTEAAGLAIVLIVFLQIAYCARGGYLTRSDALLARLGTRRPAAAAVLDGMHHLVGSVLFAILAGSAWLLFRKAWLGNEFEGAPGVIMIPVWPVKLVVALGAACMAIQLARMGVRSVVLARTRRGPPSSSTGNEP